jgi:glycosyltransferase involved in cell wall biosynthesis
VLVKQLPLISVVVPVLNERENISAVHSRV